MTFHKKRSWIKMPRRKQDCPKKMKWEEGSSENEGVNPPPSESSSDLKEEDYSCNNKEEDKEETLDTPSPKGESSTVGYYSSEKVDKVEMSPPSCSSPCDSLSLNKSCAGDSDMFLVPSAESPLDFSVRKKEDTSQEYDLLSEVDETPRKGESPLDLSLPRKRSIDSQSVTSVDKKIPRIDMPLPPLSPWGGLLPKYSPDLNLRTSVLHLSPHSDISSSSESNRALERMQELSKMGGDPSLLFQSPFSPSISTWQNHWLAKGLHEQATRDVLKCVWCKQSFLSLAELTTHMKEAKHCNMASSAQPQQAKPPSQKATDNLSFLKDSMPLPRKLVRGQDVWLGKGAEQTKQILKCMWCGQSFSSLADMTTHMQQTQHYTNIISQEQIISWKSPEEKGAAQSHVNAVLTCKVCDQAFSSLKELSSHMVKNSHYKEHIMKSISENTGRRRPSREKRKPKSLPVRKLLELERAQNEIKLGDGRVRDGSGRITCEKCGDRIETAVFVEHIRQCLGVLKGTKSPYPCPEESPAKELKEVDDIKSEPDDPGADEPLKAEAAEGSSSSVLNAIEKLIEKSFEFRGNAKNGRGPVGTSILQRLGIDESVDYSKPLIDPHSFNLFGGLTQNPFKYFRDRSASESSGCSDIPRRDTPSTPTLFGRPIKAEFDEDESPCSPKLVINEDDKDIKFHSPVQSRITPSPANSSVTPRVTPSPVSVKQENGSIPSPSKSVSSPPSVGTDALETPILDRSQGATPKSEDSISRQSTPISSSSPVAGNCVSPPVAGRSDGGGFHPLAALQKLCEKTESHISRPGASSAMVPNANVSGVPGSILAFSWACNDAVMADSIMKCAFCDTPFISKGAYRHHLSKIHFVKDGIPPDPSTVKTQTANKPCKSPQNKTEESPHSKFLKYTELAKQLSSKYVK